MLPPGHTAGEQKFCWICFRLCIQVRCEQRTGEREMGQGGEGEKSSTFAENKQTMSKAQNSTMHKNM